MKIVVSEFISLDGVVQAPGGVDEDRDGGFQHGAWSRPYFDPEKMGAAIGEGMATADALLFGRRTFETMAAAMTGGDDPIAEALTAMPKYVLSRTRTQDDLVWKNTTLLSGDDPIAAVADLRARPGRDIQVIGSASVARLLIEHDLVDEYRLMLEPILLGGGKTIFPTDSAARPLQLVSAEVAGTGVIICTYRKV
jgi:dihydrofolate reductase